MIIDKQECKDACTQLMMQTGTLRNNKPCYRAGNGKCRQDGRYKVGKGAKTSPICKNTGILDILHSMHNLDNKLNSFISNKNFMFADN